MPYYQKRSTPGQGQRVGQYAGVAMAYLSDYATSVPGKDLFHDAVKAALEKEGWVITNDPLALAFGGVDLYVDLGAERLIAATRGAEKIAIEVKSFASPSPVTEFHQALGQFLNYRIALESEDPERELFLAVPLDTYEVFFSLPFVQISVTRHQVGLIVYDPRAQEIRRWTSRNNTAT